MLPLAVSWYGWHGLGSVSCRELTSVWLTKLRSGVKLHEPDLGDYNSDDDPQSLVGKRVSSPFSKGTGGETW